jgi:hypothetical protein
MLGWRMASRLDHILFTTSSGEAHMCGAPMCLPKGLFIAYPLETNPERPFPANADIENKGLLGREVAKKRLSGFVSSILFA